MMKYRLTAPGGALRLSLALMALTLITSGLMSASFTGPHQSLAFIASANAAKTRDDKKFKTQLHRFVAKSKRETKTCESFFNNLKAKAPLDRSGTRYKDKKSAIAAISLLLKYPGVPRDTRQAYVAVFKKLSRDPKLRTVDPLWMRSQLQQLEFCQPGMFYTYLQPLLLQYSNLGLNAAQKNQVLRIALRYMESGTREPNRLQSFFDISAIMESVIVSGLISVKPDTMKGMMNFSRLMRVTQKSLLEQSQDNAKLASAAAKDKKAEKKLNQQMGQDFLTQIRTAEKLRKTFRPILAGVKRENRRTQGKRG